MRAPSIIFFMFEKGRLIKEWSFLLLVFLTLLLNLGNLKLPIKIEENYFEFIYYLQYRYDFLKYIKDLKMPQKCQNHSVTFILPAFSFLKTPF